MTCGACQLWRHLRLGAGASSFGVCRWSPSPATAREPYWHAQHPSGHLLVHFTHGQGCKAAVALPQSSNPVTREQRP